MDCIFCKIIKGEIPSYKIMENDYMYAFLDINPDSDGHTLIIPKRHYKDITDIDDQTLYEIINASKKIKQLLEIKLGCDGIIYQQNNGACQDVKHFHLHLKPYYIKKQTKKDPKEIFEILS